eukprot:scaffold2855_cov172-Skeletonema_marinoi.AAC.1
MERRDEVSGAVSETRGSVEKGELKPGGALAVPEDACGACWVRVGRRVDGERFGAGELSSRYLNKYLEVDRSHGKSVTFVWYHSRWRNSNLRLLASYT